MAKRFIDTGLFDDDWFMELTAEAKILWIYSITKCDHAGILKLNKKLFQVQTGIKDFGKILKQLGNRIITVSEKIYFIPKFIEFQYPDFPKSKVKQQASALEILKKYDLIDNGGNIKQDLNSLTTVTKLLPMSYDNDNDNGSGNEEKKQEKPKETLQEQKERLLSRRRELFHVRVFEYANKYPAEMLTEFFDYWSEATKNGSQMKWETRDTWELPRRLVTWQRNCEKYGKSPPQQTLINYQELLQRFDKGEKDIWDKYEPVKAEGKTKPLWRLKSST